MSEIIITPELLDQLEELLKEANNGWDLDNPVGDVYYEVQDSPDYYGEFNLMSGVDPQVVKALISRIRELEGKEGA